MTPLKYTPEEDGANDAATFFAENPIDECRKALSDHCGPDEALLNAMGFDWCAKRWGMGADTPEFGDALTRYSAEWNRTIKELPQEAA